MGTGTRSVGAILIGLGLALFGILLIADLRGRRREVPRLVVTGSSHETGLGTVSFRVLVPDSRRPGAGRASGPPDDGASGAPPGFRKASGFVFSNPQVEDATGRIQDVSLIRYVTPANEPSLGIVQDNGGIYRLRLDVSFEEKGLAGWLGRMRNCWKSKTLGPLSETTFGDPVSVTSDWITNAVAWSSSGAR